MIRKINAYFTEDYIRVYQAYNHSIADSALKGNVFICPPYKIDRTTWIKPSFCWMMYRSGWATKKNQERILAVDISHDGLLWILENSCLSHFDKSIHKSQGEWEMTKSNCAAIIQWDPERDIFLNRLNKRTIQIGINPPATQKYASEWILKISDITNIAHQIKDLLNKEETKKAIELVPIEKEYLVSESIKKKLGIN